MQDNEKENVNKDEKYELLKQLNTTMRENMKLTKEVMELNKQVASLTAENNKLKTKNTAIRASLAQYEKVFSM